jgi:hypothetical protein
VAHFTGLGLASLFGRHAAAMAGLSSSAELPFSFGPSLAVAVQVPVAPASPLKLGEVYRV